jgi:hypothetical protein
MRHLASLIFFLSIPIAMAQTTVWDSTNGLKVDEKPDQPKVMGWSKKANLGANFSYSSSQDVVGQTDGTSQVYGLNLKSGFYKNTENSEWRNDVGYTGATTRTPSVPRYIKSSDEFKISSIYLYALPEHPKVGPYGRMEAAAPLFIGEDVRPTVQTYNINRTDGTSSAVTASSLRLTDGFKPLTTKEAVGFFYRPVEKEKVKVELRLGVAALQVAAAGQLSVKGPNATGGIDVNELDDISQAGVEAAASVKGKWNEASGYEVGAEALTPFVTNKRSSDDRDALQLTNFDGYIKLTSNMTSWASFGYDYKVKIQPQLVERAQQIHLFVLNVNYNLF